MSEILHIIMEEVDISSRLCVVGDFLNNDYISITNAFDGRRIRIFIDEVNIVVEIDDKSVEFELSSEQAVARAIDYINKLTKKLNNHAKRISDSKTNSICLEAPFSLTDRGHNHPVTRPRNTRRHGR